MNIEDTQQIRFVVRRFELNDPNDPTFYIVGFNIVCDMNQREAYVETQVAYNSELELNDNEICSKAYSQLQSRIEEVKKTLLTKKFIIGSEFVPPVE